VIKSIIRSRVIKIRKKNYNKNIKINPDKLFLFLKKNKYNFKNFGGYYPSNNEIDDLEILYLLERKGYKISLPVIRKNYQMDFFQWSSKTPLKINKYGIPEPLSKKICYPDILFVPLVGYDNDLNRLGYGGGFYDRYISKIQKKKNIIKIGLAFSFQKIKKVPTSLYDKKLDFIITEKEILK
jgi:5-formyltetrahydrofolate cyclo-ligase